MISTYAKDIGEKEWPYFARFLNNKSNNGQNLYNTFQQLAEI
jgi:hypothetical protein